MDYKKLFLDVVSESLITEIGDAKFPIKTPVTIAKNPEEFYNPLDLELPSSLKEVYQYFSNLVLIWELVDNEAIFKEFQEVKEVKNLLNQDYDWSFIKAELLSGSIHLTEVKHLLNPDYQTTQSFYYTLHHNKKVNKEDFFVFDTQSEFSICLRKNEANQIEDNLWLIHHYTKRVYEMKMSIDDYIKSAYKTKCLRNWQFCCLEAQEDLTDILTDKNRIFLNVIISKIFGNEPFRVI